MKWIWTSFLIHSCKPQCRFYQKQIWRSQCSGGQPQTRVFIKALCLVCLRRNHNRSGSISFLFVEKKMGWPFPCLIRITGGDKSHKTRCFPKNTSKVRWKLTVPSSHWFLGHRAWAIESCGYLSRKFDLCLSKILRWPQMSLRVARNDWSPFPPRPWIPFSLTLTKPLKEKVEGELGILSRSSSKPDHKWFQFAAVIKSMWV